MKPPSYILGLITGMAVGGAFAGSEPDDIVFVEGGSFKSTKSTNHHGVNMSSFYIAKYEVTQEEWIDVMGSNPSNFKGSNLPVEMITWYESVEYCNKRSTREDLKPFYNIDRNTKDPNNQNDGNEIKWKVTINAGANGYRLPTEAEWEYAASGGQSSRSYAYSGGDDIEKVAWYWRNSGDTNLTGFWYWPAIEQNNCRTKPVGSKEPNELGLYDMSGNVREFCWDWYADQESMRTGLEGGGGGSLRVWKGGGWLGGDFCCESTFRAGYELHQRGPDQGLRVCRSQ